MAFAGRQQGGKLGNVHGEQGAVELYGLARSGKEGIVTARCHPCQPRAQAVEGLAQIGQRRLLVKLRPEECGQRLAAMGQRRLERQIGQQPARFIGGKGGDRLPIDCYTKGTKQGERNLHHRGNYSISAPLVLVTQMGCRC